MASTTSTARQPAAPRKRPRKVDVVLNERVARAVELYYLCVTRLDFTPSQWCELDRLLREMSERETDHYYTFIRAQRMERNVGAPPLPEPPIEWPTV